MEARAIYRTSLDLITLNDDSPKVDMVVPGLRDIYLRPHQQTIVHAMLAYEDARAVRNKTGTILCSNVIVLGEYFGTGKTYEIIAMILLRAIPKPIPELIAYGQTFAYRTFTGDNALIKPNLVIVGSSVLNQWYDTITAHTNLNTFMVKGHHDLRRLHTMITTGEINSYDVLLVKNGQVAGNFADITGCTKEQNNIISVLNDIMGNKCCSRAFLDDFDTINMPVKTVFPNALFTVLVSATKKNAHGRAEQKLARDFDEYMVMQSNKTIYKVTCDQRSRLYGAFEIRNKQSFVEDSINVPIINQFKYVYVNPYDKMIGLIGTFGDVNNNTLMEMLNGGATRTAAKTIGIETTSIVDMFQKILDTKYTDYIKFGTTLDAIETTLKTIAHLAPHPMKIHSVKKLNSMRDDLRSGNVLTTGICKYSSEPLTEMIVTLRAETRERFNDVGKSIHRVIDNAKEGLCQICCSELQDSDTFIVKCCGIVLCSDCGIQGNSFKTGYNRKANRDDIVGSCANCKTKINFRDLIFLNKEFSIETLLEAKGTETKRYVAEEPPVPEDEITCPKLRAMLAIIRGDDIPERQKCNMQINKLLDGTRDVPPGSMRKVVIFASFDETLTTIQDCLKSQGIRYIKMGGTHNEMHDAVQQFRTQIDVMLINSQQHCAGVNLEFCNHMILYHHISDKNVIGQVVARGQRMLRRENLQLHFLRYVNEDAIADC